MVEESLREETDGWDSESETGREDGERRYQNRHPHLSVLPSHRVRLVGLTEDPDGDRSPHVDSYTVLERVGQRNREFGSGRRKEPRYSC